MKQSVFSSLFFLAALSAMYTSALGQRPNLKVDPSGSGNFDRILMTENRLPTGNLLGGDASISFYGANTTIAAGALLDPNRSVTIPAGRAWFINSIVVSADTDCIVTVRFQRLAASLMSTVGTVQDIGVYQQEWLVFPHTGGTQTITFPNPMVAREYTQIFFRYYRKPKPNPLPGENPNRRTTPFVTASIDAKDMTDDLNWDARHKIAFMTDSYGHISSGLTVYGSEYFPAIAVDSLRHTDGKSVRRIVSSFGGATSFTAAPLVLTGNMNYAFDIGVIALGFNDAATSTVTWASRRAAFKTDIRRIINHFRKTNPGCSVVLCKPAPPHATDPLRPANIADVRLAVQEVFDSYAGAAWLKLCDFSNAYPNNDASFYNPEETAGVGSGKVHPSAKGQKVLGGILYNVLKTTPAYQKFN